MKCYGFPSCATSSKPPYGARVHDEKPMKYETSNSLLKQLGNDAGYDIDIDHYAFRRWTANEANREICVERERRDPTDTAVI
jgi:hypothetical protein